ncbi:GNAT family N-acetyltransferase [Streptomyces sp. NPDC003077]|uniref:GNAT family N-acetyltransferase n=1 Tax=Streptomyces sp. NPDC003077 TaxID=3154443 RepID=UPI0033A3DA06
MIKAEGEMHTVDAEYQRYDGPSAKGIANELLEVYAEVYDVPPYAGDPFFSVKSYGDRLDAAFDAEGFETVTARRDGRIIGYVHGATLPSDKPWWTSLGDRRPEELRKLADAGQVFWLRELMVLPEYQNQGLGRQIHDTVIAGRAESATALTCIVDNQPAHDAYLRWGYTIMGQIKHAPESPVYDAMFLPSQR